MIILPICVVVHEEEAHGEYTEDKFQNLEKSAAMINGE